MFSEFFSQNLLWFAALIIIANLLVLSFIQGRVKGASMVSALELPSLQRDGNSVIIDVNDSKDYDLTHIPDAINFPLDSINADNKKLLKHRDKATIVVCQAGSKSTKAAKLLVALGFSNVHILRGGLISWTKENLPVTAS
ncbi:MAG: rhodanese-like domain-containing protein [Acidiferrobacterales bacterium]|nr:rhodanese-like domain-containing protein [Acidiferrobacterales bacterium]